MLKSLFLHRNHPKSLHLLCRHISTTIATITTTKDDYFSLIHHISNIVRRDHFLERTLNKLPLPSPLSSDLVFRVLCATSSSPTSCLRFFTWARTHHSSYHPSSLESELLLKTLASSKLYSSMWATLSSLPTTKLSESTLCFIIQQYGRHGHVDDAVTLFNRCPTAFNCSHSVELYNALLFSLCENKLFHGAYALVRRMIRKGIAPSKATYSILVNAWCSNGKMREARVFLEEMSDKGFNPPVRGRDLLVEGLINAGYIEGAKDMVRRMVKENCVPEVSTFNVLMEAICKSGEVEFCVALYWEAAGLGFCPDINTYKVLIPAVSKMGKMEDAFRLLYNAVEDGHRPFPSLYAPIVKGLCRKAQFDDAFCFFSEMKVKGHPPNRPVYTMMITMAGRGGRFVEAANYLIEMTEVGLVPISRCFDFVTDGLKNCGKHDLAKRMEQIEVSLRDT